MNTCISNNLLKRSATGQVDEIYILCSTRFNDYQKEGYKSHHLYHELDVGARRAFQLQSMRIH